MISDSLIKSTICLSASKKKKFLWVHLSNIQSMRTTLLLQTCSRESKYYMINALSSNVDHMFVIDYDFYTIKKQRREALDINFRQAYQEYVNGNWNTSQNYLT